MTDRIDSQTRLFIDSGAIESCDPLVSFLYDLMRDHVPPGEVAKIVRRGTAPEPGTRTTFTNGYLAQYAIWLAREMRTDSVK